MTARDYIGCFITFLIVPMPFIVVANMPAIPQPAKPVWDYHCYITMSGAMDALNGLPAKQAELTKFLVFEHAFQTYCLVTPER